MSGASAGIPEGRRYVLLRFHGPDGGTLNEVVIYADGGTSGFPAGAAWVEVVTITSAELRIWLDGRAGSGTRVLGTAAENLPAGALVAVDPATGMLRLAGGRNG